MNVFLHMIDPGQDGPGEPATQSHEIAQFEHQHNTAEGLADELKDTDVVIDISNSPSFENRWQF